MQGPPNGDARRRFIYPFVINAVAMAFLVSLAGSYLLLGSALKPVYEFLLNHVLDLNRNGYVNCFVPPPPTWSGDTCTKYHARPPAGSWTSQRSSLWRPFWAGRAVSGYTRMALCTCALWQMTWGCHFVRRSSRRSSSHHLPPRPASGSSSPGSVLLRIFVVSRARARRSAQKPVYILPVPSARFHERRGAARRANRHSSGRSLHRRRRLATRRVPVGGRGRNPSSGVAVPEHGGLPWSTLVHTP